MTMLGLHSFLGMKTFRQRVAIPNGVSHNSRLRASWCRFESAKNQSNPEWCLWLDISEFQFSSF